MIYINLRIKNMSQSQNIKANFNCDTVTRKYDKLPKFKSISHLSQSCHTIKNSL